LVYENDQEFLFSAEKQLAKTFALGWVDRSDDAFNVGGVRT
jgi:hypothetical protein